ncbi:uncharacterized protein EI90DRAFT_3045662 [Cantharellus anzutake]|uniref:uncharacterized protein n=1 Tax=Cantharellus anzutake TaxID=1750568 RepID=UPI001907FDC9|nr:uncharacterized protein EI90DRAFT_3045662 [Cantharellus anzutake]KAF8336411.1 hypothetical protein EI90DRAFT_3045662 [Cantharellus anzutake]
MVDLMDIILSLLLLLGVLRSSGGLFCPLYLSYSAEAPVPILLISTNRGPLILSPLRSICHPLIYHHLPSLIQCPANTSSIATLRPTHNQDVQVWTQIFRRQLVKRRHLRTFLLVTERKQSSPPQGSSSKLLPLLLSSSLLRISIRYQIFS